MEQVPDKEEVSSTHGHSALGESCRDVTADATEQRGQRKALTVEGPPTAWDRERNYLY